MENNNEKIFGCYLDNSQCWQCLSFTSITQADDYLLDKIHHKTFPITRLIPIPYYLPLNIQKPYLYYKLTPSVNIRKINANHY